MLEMELTREQRMGLCELINSRYIGIHLSGRDYVNPDEPGSLPWFDEIYIWLPNNKVYIRITDDQLVSIVQQLLDRAGAEVVEITAVLTELDCTEPEEAS